MEQAISVVATADVARPGAARVVGRGLGAVISGIIAAGMIADALSIGFHKHFPGEDDWGLLAWGEHWLLRLAASLLATAGASIIVGALARRRGGLHAALAAAPAVIVWIYLSGAGWFGRFPFFANSPQLDVSLGNKIAESLVALATIPVAIPFGRLGVELVEPVAGHFDKRRFTLLGVKWYHYFWLPFLINVVLVQCSAVGLYTFQWFKEAWKAGESFTGFLPTIVGLLLWGTFSILFKGVVRAYFVLSGIHPIEGAGPRALAVLKNGFGLPLLAGLLQLGIILVHAGLARLFS